MGQFRVQSLHLREVQEIVFKIHAQHTSPSAETFDAVICVLGIFFLPDMAAGVRGLWRLVRPGGQMAITTFGPRAFEPGDSAFWRAVLHERPDVYKAFNPWDRINEPAALAAMLLEGGTTTPEIVAESGFQAIDSPQDFWTLVLGSGYRGTIQQLDQEACGRVCLATIDSLSRNSVSRVETNALYAICRKP